jgi:uncharacterized protein YkwD
MLAVFMATLGIGALSSGTATAATQACPNADANAAGIAMPAFERSILCVINERRAENHLRPLRPNGLLHDAGEIYVTSMFSGEFYGHHGCLAGTNNCSTVIGRLRFLGYIRPGWAWIVGETLRGAGPDTSTPNAVVQAWLDSPPHRARLLKPRFRDVGIAAVPGITDSFPTTDGVTVAAEFGFRQRNRSG